MSSFHSQRRKVLLALFMVAGLLGMVSSVQAQAAPQVSAVLFYSPGCPHCQTVITEFLPGLTEEYGSQLQVLLVDITTAEGSQVFTTLLHDWEVPEGRWGVPFLVAGERHLIGSLEIQQDLPRIIDSNLRSGLDWPAIAGLGPLLENAGLTIAEASSSPDADLASLAPATEPPLSGLLAPQTWVDRFLRDPLGNTLSVLVLLALAASLVWNVSRLRNPKSGTQPWPAWEEGLLIAAGLAVAAYLTWIEMTLTPAICGPVGDCNAVQQSEYARLFGLMPIGWLGLLGYLLIGSLWLAARRTRPEASWRLNLAVWWLALGGLLFSLYLTFLEPFVIGATCAWCLSSSVLMGLVFWQATLKRIEYQSQNLAQRRQSKRKGYAQ